MSKDVKLVNGMVIQCDGCQKELTVGHDRIHPQVYGRYCSDCTKHYSEYEVDLRKFYFKWDMERAGYIDQLKKKHFPLRKSGNATPDVVPENEKPVEAAKQELNPAPNKAPKKAKVLPAGTQGMADDSLIADLESEVKGTVAP